MVNLHASTQLQDANVIPRFEFRVEFSNEQFFGRFAQQNVLKSLACIETVHVIIVDVRLDAKLEITMETIATNITAQQYCPRT